MLVVLVGQRDDALLYRPQIALHLFLVPAEGELNAPSSTMGSSLADGSLKGDEPLEAGSQ